MPDTSPPVVSYGVARKIAGVSENVMWIPPCARFTF
jgi:hypothetical protein